MEFQTRLMDGATFRVVASFLASSKDRRQFLIQTLIEEGARRLDPIFRTNYGLRVDRITDGHYSIRELDGLDVFCEEPNSLPEPPAPHFAGRRGHAPAAGSGQAAPSATLPR